MGRGVDMAKKMEIKILSNLSAGSRPPKKSMAAMNSHKSIEVDDGEEDNKI